ncbi:16S rRNA (guanine527-N7)-methyltransferase [Rhodobacter aestuarii]|uniref:Ribosomal RNA small subunit methyltransferase G n=1 Tax=Rhodobacter aestuarii TaxID=453582 RepID=A0A1N7LFQ4_9RHOB|nr:16S rRNA (guanine(527)-N(7))-methyltransferase RsmG [Rhodobacter aestuarii]PTV95278.1 16S rRNA (guanine527-N7)-methyltransferase [Rhodobacter aestuarii]SIS72616.1 16S rRNA (guanine527-N7)-methyltransferase [Rhodobacter aestuarii]
MSGAELFQRHFDVSRETLDRLTTLEALLRKWNPAINLVSAQTLDDIWGRHFLDSAQLFHCIEETPASWADLGSGGGFPGLIIGILAKEKWPEMQLTLVESDKRKSAFLINAARELGLGLKVKPERIEKTAPLQADVVSARALAALPKLLEFAERHLGANGTAIFPKGERWKEEVALAEASWSFTSEPRESLTDPQAVVLKIRGLKRV